MLVCHMTHCGGTTFFGDMNKGLLTTDTKLIRMDQSTNSTNIQLGKPMSCIGITNMYITIMYMWGRGYLHNQKWLKDDCTTKAHTRMETELQCTSSLQAVGLFEGCFTDGLSHLSFFQVVQLIFLSSTQFALSLVLSRIWLTSASPGWLI